MKKNGFHICSYPVQPKKNMLSSWILGLQDDDLVKCLILPIELEPQKSQQSFFSRSSQTQPKQNHYLASGGLPRQAPQKLNNDFVLVIL